VTLPSANFRLRRRSPRHCDSSLRLSADAAVIGNTRDVSKAFRISETERSISVGSLLLPARGKSNLEGILLRQIAVREQIILLIGS